MSLHLDKSGWKRVAFGDVVGNVNKTVSDPSTMGLDRVIAMEHLDPGELSITRWGNVADGTTFIRRVKPGQTLFGKRRAYQRKAAYAEFDAICSGDILTFEADPAHLLPEFLPFIVQSDDFYDHALGTSAGSLSPRTNWRDLSTFEFDLPPLDEQSRIADLLWSMERYRKALRARNEAVVAALSDLLAVSFATAEGESSSIASVCSVVVGGVWGSPEGESEVDVLALGPRVYAGGATRLMTGGSPVRSITQRQLETRLVRPGDIILERSGGSPSQPVGRVVIAEPGLEPCIPTDFQRLLRPDPQRIVPEYLFWSLRHDWTKGVPRDFSRKTTNITNLAVSDYLARQIEIPSIENQKRLIAQVTRVESVGRRHEIETEALDDLRSSLFDEIFGGAA